MVVVVVVVLGGLLSLSKTQSAFASQINPSVFLKPVISVLVSKSGNLRRILQDNEHFYDVRFSVFQGLTVVSLFA